MFVFSFILFFVVYYLIFDLFERFVENKREAGELAEKEGRKLKSEDYLYQVIKKCIGFLFVESCFYNISSHNKPKNMT